MCTGGEQLLAQNSDKLIMGASALGAAGNLLKGSQAKQYYNYQADQAMADAQAEQQMGEARAGRVRKAGALAQSQVRAGYGASGVDVNTGTPVAVSTKLEQNVSSDALTELLTGQRRAASLQATAQGYRAAGANAQVGGYMSATKSLLSGVAQSVQAEEMRKRWQRRTENINGSGGYDPYLMTD